MDLKNFIAIIAVFVLAITYIVYNIKKKAKEETEKEVEVDDKTFTLDMMVNFVKKRLDEIIQMLGLENRKEHLPNELSGGQQQRVAIGRALINNPSIILADEPTGNLDSKASKEIIDLLKNSNKKYNQTILLITHDENIAKQADRIITIQDGKI